MGLLVEGVWQDRWYDTKKTGGKFVRKPSSFRNWVTSDGEPGPSGEGGFQAEPGRYHLYVSHACPWAHRALIFRALKGLEDAISLSVVHPHMLSHGWSFQEGEGTIPDPINGCDYLHQVYTAADATYTGRVTVPVLWDKQTATIVNNESSEIIRMFNHAFDRFTNRHYDFYPEALRPGIDEINDFVYQNINNGVYKAGFANSQEVYEEEVHKLFAALNKMDKHLDSNRYLMGPDLTEADWRLFTTLVRFDNVYVGHFKCNIRRIADYPNLYNYLLDLYQVPGVAETVDMDHIKAHYYASHDTINPTAIVPVGPAYDYNAPHDRGRLPGEPYP